MWVKSGIDIVELQRFDDMDSKLQERLTNRVCSASEKKCLKKKPHPPRALASFFAAKEAFAKALGTGIGGPLSFHDIQLDYAPSGQPLISYVGEPFKSESAHWSISCSISHSNSHLVAVVVIVAP